MGPVTISRVLNAVSDDAALQLFRLVALSGGTSELLRSKMNITRKQYYSRLFKLVKCGLIRKKDNEYFVTTLGKVMYDALATIDNAIASYWKIKVVDSLRFSDGIPVDEQKKLIETLIQDQAIKGIISK